VHTLQHDPVIGTADVSDNQHPGNNLVSNTSYDAAPAVQPGDFGRAEGLIAAVYESLRGNPDLFNRTLLLVTYDEHGGLYDHVPPVAGVPNPGGDPTFLRRLFRALYYRKASAFDFSVLGPRVPAIVISPYLEAGTVNAEPRDHASVASTLRALFAPNAHPLTRRDAWAPPFHHLLTRTGPRPDLPDLSGHVQAAAAAPRAELVAGPAALPPAHYQPYVQLADTVRQRLRARGVPEAAGVPGMPPFERAAETARAFGSAAQRNRSSLGKVP
jgi:phospholipase C